MTDSEQNMGNKVWQKTMHCKVDYEYQEGFFTTFFTSGGPAIRISVPKGKFVNGKFYKTKVFRRLKKKSKNGKPATGLVNVRLLRDSVSSYRVSIVQDTF